MPVNRHNYEEYFILYMDNELAPEERRAVEAFVQLHPDLKEELDLLMQFKLEPDTAVVFNGKEELMKVNGETPISLSNYEEWMVLYHDNELSVAQRNMMDAFLATHPDLQQEFEQLKRARIEPALIVFPGKASLYRKEEPAKRIAWWRYAAAAVLLLTISITAVIVINNKKTDDGGIVGNKPTKSTIPKTNEQATNKETVRPQESIVIATQPGDNELSATTKTSNKDMIVKQDMPIQKDKVENIIAQDKVKEEPVVAIRPPSNNLPSSASNPNINTSNKTDVAISNQIPTELIQHKKGLTNDDVTTADPDPSDYVAASMDEKKNKGRGLFRKIARTFEKRTNIDPTDDNRLLVAGLAIRLK